MMSSRSTRGYTLIEMIVSIGVFSVIMLAATGAYLSLIKLDREARATNDVANNLTFALDSMSRAIRTGTEYKCNNSSNPVTQNCATGSGGTSFGFRDSDSPSRSVLYYLENNQLKASINGTAYVLTDPRVRIDALTFYVRGVGTGDGIQPNVTFTVRGSIQTSPTVSKSFTIQTGATQRFLDI